MARLAARLVARPAPFTAAAVALTLLLGAAAARVRPDFSLEQLFPIWDQQRADYDRFKAAFPGEDARAVVLVQADDLFTSAGVAPRRARKGCTAPPGPGPLASSASTAARKGAA